MIALISMFFTIFIAELGDKTQVTTMLFASNGTHKPLTIILTVGLALFCSTLFAVAVGTFAQKYLESIPVKLISGLLFIAMGLYTIIQHYYFQK